MHKGFILTLATVATGLLLMTGAEPLANSADSSQITTSQPSQHRSRGQQKIRIGHTIYTIKTERPAYQHLSDYQIQLCLRQLKAQTLHNVKMERADDLSTSIAPNRKLNRLATLRARQVAKRFSHYDHHHRPMTTVDAQKVGLPHGFQASENIASAGLGNCTVLGDPKIYHNHNGRDMANMSNDGMMHYDALENNGHRKNILSTDSSLIGVGVAYSRHKHQFYLAEDFGNRNPRSSADVDHKSLELSQIHLKTPRRLPTAQKILQRIDTWCHRGWQASIHWLRGRI